jgi:serine/threonine-protein kinase
MPPPERSRRPKWLVPAAAWIAGTALAVVLSMVAINLAGAGVSDQSSVALSRTKVDAALSSDATTERHPTSRTGRHAATTTAPGASSRPLARVPATTSPSVTGHVEDSGGGHGSSGSSGGGSAPTTTAPKATTTSTTTPSSVREVTAQGGTATVQCIGSSISLVSARPANGFELDSSSVSGGHLDVEFSATGHSSEIHATCASGVITTHVEESSDG